MSEPTRYTAVGSGVVKTDPDGMLIAYGHYVELKAKCERLEDERVHDLNQIGGLQQELASLRASSFVTAVPVEHYERIIKAGDAMASSIQFNEEMAQDYNGPTIVHQSVQRWNAAKEGNAK